jgi:hypothetical protein
MCDLSEANIEVFAAQPQRQGVAKRSSPHGFVAVPEAAGPEHGDLKVGIERSLNRIFGDEVFVGDLESGSVVEMSRMERQYDKVGLGVYRMRSLRTAITNPLQPKDSTMRNLTLVQRQSRMTNLDGIGRPTDCIFLGDNR